MRLNDRNCIYGIREFLRRVEGTSVSPRYNLILGVRECLLGNPAATIALITRGLLFRHYEVVIVRNKTFILLAATVRLFRPRPSSDIAPHRL